MRLGHIQAYLAMCYKWNCYMFTLLCHVCIFVYCMYVCTHFTMFCKQPHCKWLASYIITYVICRIKILDTSSFSIFSKKDLSLQCCWFTCVIQFLNSSFCVTNIYAKGGHIGIALSSSVTSSTLTVSSLLSNIRHRPCRTLFPDSISKIAWQIRFQIRCVCVCSCVIEMWLMLRWPYTPTNNSIIYSNLRFVRSSLFMLDIRNVRDML